MEPTTIIEEKVYIFGAHSRAQTFGVYIKSLYPDTEIAAYLYDNDEDNPEHIGDDPVFYLETDWRWILLFRCILRRAEYFIRE